MLADSKIISTLLFDLGGVLVELNGPPIRQEWRAQDQLHEDAWLHWMSSHAVRQFERGKILPDVFASQLVDEFDLLINEEEFMQHFLNWLSGVYKGAHALLKELKPHYQLGVFSNTNELHWPRMMNEMQLDEYFDHCFASFEIGLMKPDKEAFEYVIQQMGVLPEEILFLDDTMKNIDAARLCGMQAVQVKGAANARETLRSLGLLSKPSVRQAI
jgi:putative hydrolase of the HAD superfamily